MRRWIGRAFWLAAWSFWLWLGFGLYRELPRDLGPVVFQAPIAPVDPLLSISERVHISSIDRPRMLVETWDQDELTRAFKIWDIRSCQLVAEFKPVETNNPVVLFSERLGLAADTRKSDLAKASDDEVLYVLNANTGERFDLDPKLVPLSFHGDKPLLAATSSLDQVEPRIVIYDLVQRRSVFDRKWRKFEAAPTDCQFNQTGDEVAITFRKGEIPKHIEYWNIPHTRLIQTTSVEKQFLFQTSVAGSSRVSFDSFIRHLHEVEVMDARTGVSVFSSAQPFQRKSGQNSFNWSPSNLSPDGRFLLWNGSLSRIDDGRTLWTSGAHEGEEEGAGSGSFAVNEDWPALLPSLAAGREFACIAVRDLTNGELKFRFWKSRGSYLLIDEVRGIVATHHGSVLSIPRVNYPLLALCQAILASPLVLLWTGMRWRRKRLASVGSGVGLCC